MNTLTLIENVGCHGDRIAVFLNDSLLKMVVVEGGKKELAKAKSHEIDSFKIAFPDGKVAVLECIPSFQEFVSLTDFPSSLAAYFKS